jgi:hypothetical protein
VGAHRYRQNLFKLRFLTPLLDAYAMDGDAEALEEALALGLDFAHALRRRGPDTPGEAWTDKVVGDRAPFVGYLTRAAACEDLIDRDEAATLIDSVRQHAVFLTEDQVYAPDNHGLFADRGLYLSARYAPFLAEAPEWKRLARRRFESTLRGRLSEGVWLEHSSNYQFLALRPVEEFIELLGGDAELERLERQMKAAAAWFVEPDGEITQFGDSNLEPVPRWGLRRASRLDGMKAFFGAGFAFVRVPSAEGEGYLAVTAGFHNLTHKHADELSFELYDRGHRVVTDTGLYHKDPGPERRYVLSAAAHSTLTVDGRDWAIDDSTSDYGSALDAVGAGDGWYAIEAHNPLVRRQGASHSRLFLYRPGSALLVIDRVRSQRRHRYRRHVQLGPDLRISGGRGSTSLSLEASGFHGSLFDSGPSRRSEVRGRKHPLQGFTSPDFRRFDPRWTVRFDSRGRDLDRALAIGLDGQTWRAAPQRWDAREAVISIDLGREGSELTVVRDGHRLAVRERAAR